MLQRRTLPQSPLTKSASLPRLPFMPKCDALHTYLWALAIFSAFSTCKLLVQYVCNFSHCDGWICNGHCVSLAKNFPLSRDRSVFINRFTTSLNPRILKGQPRYSNLRSSASLSFSCDSGLCASHSIMLMSNILGTRLLIASSQAFFPSLAWSTYSLGFTWSWFSLCPILQHPSL
jgi:hypothetical protein